MKLYLSHSVQGRITDRSECNLEHEHKVSESGATAIENELVHSLVALASLRSEKIGEGLVAHLVCRDVSLTAALW